MAKLKTIDESLKHIARACGIDDLLSFTYLCYHALPVERRLSGNSFKNTGT